MRCTEQSQGVLKLRVVAEGQQGDWRSSHQVIRLPCHGVVTAAIAIRQLRWIFFFLMQQATPPSCSVVFVRSQHNSEYRCTSPTWCIFSKFGTTQHYKIIHLILTKQLRGQYCCFFFLEKKTWFMAVWLNQDRPGRGRERLRCVAEFIPILICGRLYMAHEAEILSSTPLGSFPTQFKAWPSCT